MNLLNRRDNMSSYGLMYDVKTNHVISAKLTDVLFETFILGNRFRLHANYM